MISQLNSLDNNIGALIVSLWPLAEPGFYCRGGQVKADSTSGGGGGCCPLSALRGGGGGGGCCPLSADSAGGGGGARVLSAVGRFYERGGRGGCCPLSADSTSVRGPL